MRPIGPVFGQRSGLLRPVQHRPRPGEQDDAAADGREAQDVEGTEMRIAAPAEEHLQEVAGVVGQPMDARKARLEPPREQVDRERESYISVKSASMKALNAPN